MKKVKVALIGTGNWSLQHCRILSQHPKVEFCGILGRDKERTKKRAKLYDVPFYIDLKELIKNQKPDLINISLPNEHHYEMTMKVIKSNCHLFVEKPLVFSINEANNLIKEAETVLKSEIKEHARAKLAFTYLCQPQNRGPEKLRSPRTTEK